MNRRLLLGAIILAASHIPSAEAASCPHEKQIISETLDTGTPNVPGYSEEIREARVRAIALYERGFPDDSSSVMRSPPGFVIAVAVNGKVVWTEGFGFADLEQCVPAKPTTKFRIGSTSKLFTAAAAVLLYQEGELDLDAPVQRYVPWFPIKGQPITTRELLGHLAGIRHYNLDELATENQRYYSSVRESVGRFMNDPLVAVPGSRFSYSSYGYNLVSAVIQGAAKEDFLTFVHDRVFVPLKMPDTTADENATVVASRARWYALAPDGSYRNSSYADLSYKWASGGFLSTAEDLASFGSAFLRPGFLHSEALKLMFTPQVTTSGTTTHCGFGWFIYDAGQRGPERVYRHDGSSVGSSSELIIYPDYQVVVAWVMNTDSLRLSDHEIHSVVAPFLRQRAGNANPDH